MNHNLIARILVAIVTIPAILWISYQGGLWLMAMLLFFCLIGAYEFLSNEGYSASSPVLWIAGLAIALLMFVFSGFTQGPNAHVAGMGASMYRALLGFVLLTFFFLASAMMFAIGRKSPEELFRRHSRLLWGVMYLGLTWPTVYIIGSGQTALHGGDALLFLFALLWVGDTAALGFGSWLGKRKLAPSVSPNKTWAGFVGGIIGALVVGLIMHFWKFQHVAIWHMLLISFGCSVTGQLGDLVESMWKRSLKIKDSSNLIPGHGGILDRFDSLLFAAPFMFAYITAVLR